MPQVVVGSQLVMGWAAAVPLENKEQVCYGF